MKQVQLFVTVAAALCALTVQSRAAEDSAVLERARAAVGLGRGGPSVTGLKLGGTFWSSQTVTTDMKANERRSQNRESALEIRLAFPNRFVRVESDRGFAMTVGYSGTRGFSRIEALTPGNQGSGGDLTGAGLTRRQLELWQLSVGALGLPMSVTGLQLNDVDRDRLQLTGPDGFKARLDLDPATGRPTKIVRRTKFSVVPPRTVFGPATAGGGVGRLPDNLPEDDLIMTFSDRRLVNGLWLPYRITISGKGVDMNEYRFKEITINPQFTAKDFE